MSLNIVIETFSSKLVDNVVGVAIPLMGGFAEKLRFLGTDFSTSDDDDDRLLVAVLVASPRRPTPCISN
jgi:hypothetical protein